jgi:hypothetical protein
MSSSNRYSFAWQLFTAIRFLLLSGQAAAVAGLLSFALWCKGGCGGHGEAINAIGFAAITAIVMLAVLVAHYNNTRKSKPEFLEKQVWLQWAWLGVTSVVLIVVFL